jgi:hypothetical protein
MRTKSTLITVIGLVMFAWGCNNNSTNPMASLNPGALAFDFPDGSEFLSSHARVDTSNGYIVSATQDQTGLIQNEIHLSIPENANLPYTVLGSNGAYITYYDLNANNTYEANGAQGFCSITVTQISPTFEGTFYATTICNSTSDSVRTLSNGEFNATYQ